MQGGARLGKERRQERQRLEAVLPLLYFPLAIFFQEMVVKAWSSGTVVDRGTWYTLCFSLALGAVCDLLCSLLGEWGNVRVSRVLSCLLTLWYLVQTVYYTIFRMFMTVYSMGAAGKIWTFWMDILNGIRTAWLPLLLLLLPTVLLFCLGRRFTPKARAGRRVLIALALAAVGCHGLGVVSVNLSTGGALSPRYLYYEEFVPDLSVSNFGVMTTLRLDLCQLLGLGGDGLPDPVVTPEPTPEATPTPSDGAENPDPTPTPVVYEPNVMEIDFDALAGETTDETLRQMAAYFASVEPTMQNEYTGLFEGKNLLWFTAEGFSRFAVDPEITPTLYKLANSGFVFENFYNPLWWVSTSDGEYVATTSLIPKPGVWSMYRSGSNDMYFAMGNQLRALGYKTMAFHNHTWDYYHRDVSHPNLGYDYRGLGHGLDVTPVWPESDVEMMQLSLPEIVGDQPFHAYYMTVSGHMNYTFLGNSMAAKHRDEVGHEDMSENARAYLACQMELDQALEYTLQYLEETGHLEDTVICLSADHYPYGLEQSVLDELNGGPLDMRFDVYKSTLILWSGDMEEPVHVTKPCSSLDILPTLSNLFGLEYDSRLLMGRDILSDSPGLVVLSDRSYITDLGRYDSKADHFTPNEGAEIPEDYVVTTLRQVNNMFSYSKLILEQDYYAKLGLYHDTE